MQKLSNRIEELEQMEQTMWQTASQKRIELATKEAECIELREEIARNVFENTPEYSELVELRTTDRVLKVYKEVSESGPVVKDEPDPEPGIKDEPLGK